MTDDERDEIAALIKDNLHLEVLNHQSYNGGMGNSGNMYDKTTTVVLMFDNEAISEIDITPE